MRMNKTETDWLVIIAVILVVLWFLGLTFAASLGSVVHLLLAIAIIIIAIRLIRGEKI